MMRQAGRYLPQYRAVRARTSFLGLLKAPDLACEVTLQPIDAFALDAAILFSDILVPLEAMGMKLAFLEGEGPSLEPVRDRAAIDRLAEPDPESEMPYVYEAIRRIRAALAGRVPLIGFAGAPFTLASYAVEGGTSKTFTELKRLLFGAPEAARALLDKLARVVTRYLEAQIAAGAEAVQLFDSWVGVLAPEDYRTFVLPHTRALIRALTPGTPVIHFGTGTASLLPSMRAAGGDVIGLDWRIDLDAGWAAVGHDVAVQGNLDPVVLLSKPAYIRQRVKDILERAGGRAGHIFNLGHGILPQTPVEHARALVEMVHELSDRR